MSEPSRVRVGDAERDDAVALLTEHMAAGRLDHDEFDERVGQALAAHTRGELDSLFDDLPGRRPGETPEPARGATAAPIPVVIVQPDEEVEDRRHWWTSSLLFFVPLALTMLVGPWIPFIGALVPVAGLWVWWIGPNVAAGFDERDREIERRKEQGSRQLGDR